MTSNPVMCFWFSLLATRDGQSLSSEMQRCGGTLIMVVRSVLVPGAIAYAALTRVVRSDLIESEREPLLWYFVAAILREMD